MSDLTLHADSPRDATWVRSPVVWAAGCYVVGIAAGRWLHRAELGVDASMWCAAAVVVALAAMLLHRLSRRQTRWTRVLAGAVVIFAGAAWWQLRVGDAGANLITPEPGQSVLVDVEGVIEGDPYHRMEARGELGRFDYRPPKTLLLLRVKTVHTADGPVESVGGVIVDIPAFDDRARSGDRVRVLGWFSRFHGRANPGERDFRQTMADRVSVKSRGNLSLVGAPTRDRETALSPSETAFTASDGAASDAFSRFRATMSDRASRALHVGLSDRERGSPHDEQVAAMLDLLLLGDRRGDTGDLDESFRRAGVSHVLAISGMHLAILAAGVFFVVQIVSGRPGRATWVTIAVVVVYVLVVPPRVPVLRAAVMTLAALWGLASSRRPGVVSVMCLAALGLLIWRPGDLFSPGFQLSFTVVLGLVLFTNRVSARILPPDPDAGAPVDDLAAISSAGFIAGRARRFLVDYVAVTIVAWTVSLPLIAHHFGAVTPAGLVMGVVMVPVVAVLLWVGYMKLVVSLVFPSLGAWLAAPLWTLGSWTVGLVESAAGTPGASFDVPTPSAMWTVASIAVAFTLLDGRFARRRLVGLACVLICVGWAAAPVLVERATADRHALRVNMFAVGNGSAFLVRSGGDAMLFDCGSSNYLDITTGSVAPSLRALGVTRVPTVVLSHPDLDHFSGVVELVDAFGVQRVIVAQPFLDEAEAAPWSATAAVLERLGDRGVDIDVIAAGWRTAFGRAEIEAIWPPPGAAFERNNDSSLVLSIRAAGRRIMLTGDIQQEAMTMMLAANTDLKADAVELPHHGSMVPAAPDWLAAVEPEMVLQSSGDMRLRYDKWADLLAERGVTRHVTAWHGMTELRVDAGGTMTATRFIDGRP